MYIQLHKLTGKKQHCVCVGVFVFEGLKEVNVDSKGNGSILVVNRQTINKTYKLNIRSGRRFHPTQFGRGAHCSLVPHPPLHTHTALVVLKQQWACVGQSVAAETLVPILVLPVLPLFSEHRWLTDDERRGDRDKRPRETTGLVTYVCLCIVEQHDYAHAYIMRMRAPEKVIS